MNYHLLLLGLGTTPRTPITQERLPWNGSQRLLYNFSKMFVGAQLLGHQILTGADCGAHALWARTPLSRISDMQNSVTLAFHLESIINSVSLGPKLAPAQVVWCILTRLRCD